MVSYCWGAPLALPPVSLTTSLIIEEHQDEYPRYQQVLSCHKTCTLVHIQFLGPCSLPTSHPDSPERVRIGVLRVSLCLQIVVFPLATSPVAKQARNRRELKHCPGHEIWLFGFERSFLVYIQTGWWVGDNKWAETSGCKCDPERIIRQCCCASFTALCGIGQIVRVLSDDGCRLHHIYLFVCPAL
jgi:hypothetical protein